MIDFTVTRISNRSYSFSLSGKKLISLWPFDFRFNTSSSSSSGFPDPFGAAPTSSSTSNANSTPTNQQFAGRTHSIAPPYFHA